MEPVKARVFRNGANQAIRIPVDMSFDADEVTLEKAGEALIVRPLRSHGWEAFFADPAMVLPEDFDTGEDLPPEEDGRS